MNSRKSFRSMMIVPLFGVLSAVAACSGQAQTDGNASTNAAVTTAAQEGTAKEMHGPHMQHGPASLLFAALHEDINLTDAQRTTIKAAIDTLEPPAPPADAGAKKTALVAAIRAGKIDSSSAALKPEVADFSAHKVALAKALTTLHDTLNKDQRAALVAAVQKRAAEHEGGKKFEGKHHGEHMGPMGMLDGIDLTQAQKDAIKAKLEANKPAPPPSEEKGDEQKAAWKAQHEANRKEMEARLQTFASDSFDANAFLAPPTNAPQGGPAMHEGRFLKNLEVIVPLLTPAQREQLAAKIEAGPKMAPKVPEVQ